MVLLLQNNEDIDYYVFITRIGESTTASGNQLEFFKLLGIEEKVRIFNKPIRCETVIVPENDFVYREYFSDDYKKIISTVVNNALEKCDKLQLEVPKKIYLSRSRFSRAVSMEIGTKALDKYFEHNGYCILFPEKLSLSELIYYLQNADKVASTSGTVAHNTLFCKEGTNIVIIERSSAVNNFQLEIDHMMNQKTVCVDANYMIYPVCQAIGPCMYAYNDYFKAYATDNGEIMPPDSDLIKKIRKNLILYYSRFIAVYKLHSGISFQFQIDREMDLYFEAYTESIKSLEKYISGFGFIRIAASCLFYLTWQMFCEVKYRIKSRICSALMRDFFAEIRRKREESK